MLHGIILLRHLTERLFKNQNYSIEPGTYHDLEK